MILPVIFQLILYHSSRVLRLKRLRIRSNHMNPLKLLCRLLGCCCCRYSLTAIGQSSDNNMGPSAIAYAPCNWRRARKLSSTLRGDRSDPYHGLSITLLRVLARSLARWRQQHLDAGRKPSETRPLCGKTFQVGSNSPLLSFPLQPMGMTSNHSH